MSHCTVDRAAGGSPAALLPVLRRTPSPPSAVARYRSRACGWGQCRRYALAFARRVTQHVRRNAREPRRVCPRAEQDGPEAVPVMRGEMRPGLVIRPASASDAEVVTRIYIDSWNASYGERLSPRQRRSNRMEETTILSRDPMKHEAIDWQERLCGCDVMWVMSDDRYLWLGIYPEPEDNPIRHRDCGAAVPGRLHLFPRPGMSHRRRCIRRKVRIRSVGHLANLVTGFLSGDTDCSLPYRHRATHRNIGQSFRLLWRCRWQPIRTAQRPLDAGDSFRKGMDIRPQIPHVSSERCKHRDQGDQERHPYARYRHLHAPTSRWRCFAHGSLYRPADSEGADLNTKNISFRP